MVNKAFNTVRVADGSLMEVWVTYPDERRNFPAVILLYEVFGLNSYIRSVAERLRMAGYAVFVPDLFHRIGRLIQLPYSSLIVDQHYVDAVSEADLLEDIGSILILSRSLPQIQQDKIGVLGFGIGGRFAFIANSAFRLAAGISFYGYGIETLSMQPLELHSQHLFFWAGKDALITSDQVNRIYEWNARHDRDFTSVTISYAEHGFHCEERGSYHPLAARQAWLHTLAFLDYLLK